MNGLFTITKANVKSALVYGLLVLGASFLLAGAQSVLQAGTIFGLDWKHIVDSAVIATLPIGIAGLSLFKNFLTDSRGKFLGKTEVIPDKTNTDIKHD